MNIECTDNGGFEDQLTQGQLYKVHNSQGYSLQIKDDTGQVRWYGRLKFSTPVCHQCSSKQAA